jgi:hypothetical protein
MPDYFNCMFKRTSKFLWCAYLIIAMDVFLLTKHFVYKMPIRWPGFLSWQLLILVFIYIHILFRKYHYKQKLLSNLLEEKRLVPTPENPQARSI